MSFYEIYSRGQFVGKVDILQRYLAFTKQMNPVA